MGIERSGHTSEQEEIETTELPESSSYPELIFVPGSGDTGWVGQAPELGRQQNAGFDRGAFLVDPDYFNRLGQKATRGSEQSSEEPSEED